MNGDGPILSPDLFSLWAKGAPKVPGDLYHPLICHLIDVGAVAALLWTDGIPDSAQRWFAAQLGTDVAGAARWAAFWAAIHDLGKASPAFQTREVFQSPVPHGTISTILLRSLLAAPPIAIDRNIADRLATVIGGHHGVFPLPKAVDEADGKRQQLGIGVWKEHQRQIFTTTARLLRTAGLPPPERLTNAGALWLAGFISVADWIGSNSDFFPFAAVHGQLALEESLEHYLTRAEQQAAAALTALGWTAWPRDASPRTFAQLFPRFSPNELQRQTIALADGLDHPGLVIVEAPMGEGKTEAALYLADRGNAALGMRGHYIALPTQATSNQMFFRVTEFLRQRYPAETVNTQLLHGHAILDSDFRALRADERSFLTALTIPADRNLGFDGAPPGVVAAAWFTARKRGLLAPFGVGTVDQTLLAVLQTRHFFVRLLGLAGKTVIFDEVHAYDTYMSVLLERLLGWLAALGCSVVLLSATLPHARRQQLLAAYAGQDEPVEASWLADADYPRLTWRSGASGGVIPVRTGKPETRIAIQWIPSSDAGADLLGARLAAALRDGGCAAVICNTVRGAQQTYRHLRQWFPAEEVGLFHARFRYDERASRERDTLRQFGKPGAEVNRPHRRVLVATQVIEQSLDLDFDLMVTELAPVDLVLQRGGRLHRHDRDERPARLRAPALWLLAPEERDEEPVFAGGATWVYAEHILLRSWLALRGRDAIDLPGDITSLIERVYDDNLPCPDPRFAARWAETAREMQEKRRLHKRFAKDRLILPPDYDEEMFLKAWNSELEEDDPGIHQQLQALTRLGEQTVTAICLLPEEMAQLQPRAANAGARAEDLLRRSVALSDRRIVRALADQSPPASWQRTALLRHCRLVELDATGEAVIAGYRLRIDPELGVVIGSDGEE